MTLFLWHFKISINVCRRYRVLGPDGYRFLLLETHTQMWVLLREYIRTAEAASGVLICKSGWCLGEPCVPYSLHSFEREQVHASAINYEIVSLDCLWERGS